MKWIYILVGLLLCISSCKVVDLPYTRTACDPYVKTWSGETFTGTTVERKPGRSQKDIIRIDSVSVKSKEVAFYSTGHDNYANVGKKAFARQVAAGEVNLYQYISYSRHSTKPQKYRLAGIKSQNLYAGGYFIQKRLNEPLEYLNYRNLRSMIAPQTPAAKMLEKYRRSRILPRIIDYTFFPMMVFGEELFMLGLFLVALFGGSNYLVGTGLIVFEASIACLLINSLLHYFSVKKLFKAALMGDETQVGTKK